MKIYSKEPGIIEAAEQHLAQSRLGANPRNKMYADPQGVKIFSDLIEYAREMEVKSEDGPMDDEIAAKLEEVYEYVRTNRSDNKPYSIFGKMRGLFPDVFEGYKCKPYRSIPEKGIRDIVHLSCKTPGCDGGKHGILTDGYCNACRLDRKYPHPDMFKGDHAWFWQRQRDTGHESVVKVEVRDGECVIYKGLAHVPCKIMNSEWIGPLKSPWNW